MSLIEIVSAGLKANGFDGLVNPGVCACVCDDLSPGGCLTEDCNPGYKHTHSQRPADWVISEEKTPLTDVQIENVINECC